MKNSYKNIFFFFLCFLLIFSPLYIDRVIKINFTFALEVDEYPTAFNQTVTNQSSFIEYARYLFNIGMAIAGLLAVIVIVFGGLYYLISLGRGQFTDEGKQWLRAGILGLLILISAYLIAYTINPNLVYFNLQKLIPLLKVNNQNPGDFSNIPVAVYEEIPLGILTENLLSRTMDCYAFDSNGDPLPEQIKTDDGKTLPGPTFLEYDRVKCFLKLSEAIEKKADVIKELSKKIAELMKDCQCSPEKGCEADWPKNQCIYNVTVGNQNLCKNNQCNYTANCRCTKKTCDLCPPGTKNKIEHGLIKLDVKNNNDADPKKKCDYSNKEYRGLDEFRPRPQYSSVSFIELPPVKVNGKVISVINLDIWKELRLIEQLMYLKDKISQIKSRVQEDINNLNNARKLIASPRCKTVKSSVDFINLLETTKKEDKVILGEKTFKDTNTKQLIDSSKSCKGFNYSNSDCYSKCQNICPELINQNLGCYQKCKNCDNKNGDQKEACLEEQKICTKNCYDNRKCPAGTSPFATFPDCISSCKQECSALCDKEYASCPDDLNMCKENCGNDSKCVLTNEEKCIMDFNKLKKCTDVYKDPDNLKNCIDNSFKCKYCSDQYSGYLDCIKNGNQYSSSFLYQNPGFQKCLNPFAMYTSGPNTGKTCLDIYPETSKCPSASTCPECPCGIVYEILDNTNGDNRDGDNRDNEDRNNCPAGLCMGADGVCIPGNCNGNKNPANNNNKNSTTSSSINILGYRVCTGDCNEYNYKGDPLNFYCEIGFEQEAALSGKMWTCIKNDEIPVGQTVDDAKKWATEFISNIDNFLQKTSEMVKYIKGIGEEKNYCQCDSECGGGKKACHTECKYHKDKIVNVDPETGIETISWHCYCERPPCSGNPCQKMINLLLGGAGGDCPEVGKGVDWYYKEIQNELELVSLFVSLGGRTDVVKELSYSRKKMNECSQKSVQFGKEVKKTLSCTRAYPGTGFLSNRCYGILDGEVKVPARDLTDNWFCCQTSY